MSASKTAGHEAEASARDTFEEAIRARDEFLSIAAHELRNPLSSIVLSVESLIRLAEHTAGVPPHFVQRLERLQRHIAQFTSRATTLLDVSRITAGEMQLEVEEFDLVGLALEVIERLGEESARAACPIAVHLPPSAVGRWDRLRVEQVLNNLLSNAVKYGAGRRIDLRLRAFSGQVCLFVRDRGIGICGEDQARIFQRFERAVSRRSHGGFGIGLWIVRQIVGAMGGQISVRSRHGHGSVFRVVLPRRMAAQEQIS